MTPSAFNCFFFLVFLFWDFLLNEWNLKKYYNLIIKLIFNKKKLKYIAKNAQKFAKENFNPKKYQFKLEKIYKLLTNK